MYYFRHWVITLDARTGKEISRLMNQVGNYSPEHWFVANNRLYISGPSYENVSDRGQQQKGQILTVWAAASTS
jgi:hypothetical protein